MQLWSGQRGVSLIEVMMAVLIFSIGLIGLASLMVMATRSNHAAYLRTQVTFLASNMADRMSANPGAVWSGTYNSTGYPVSSSTAGNNDCSSVCSPAALAAADQRMWSSQLKTFLPNSKASIACGGVTSAGYDPTAQLNLRPPYGGNCKMTVQWAERGAGDKAHSDAATQTFAWEFQP
ncbi:MAG: type IV pilus modification protein PilV [Rhodanobacter sp.]